MASHALPARNARLLGFARWLLLPARCSPPRVGAARTMEQHGHVVTGMDNQIVWGLPHVFAVFLIVAASGALNVASVASVFGRAAYKPLAPLSGLLASALLLGGLAVLLLDLGRPDRLVVALTHYNFTLDLRLERLPLLGLAASSSPPTCGRCSSGA